MRLKDTGAEVLRWSGDDPAGKFEVRDYGMLVLAPLTSMLVDKLTDDMSISYVSRAVPDKCHITPDTNGVLVNMDCSRVHLVNGKELAQTDCQLVTPGGWFFVIHKDPAMCRRLFLNIRCQREWIRANSKTYGQRITHDALRLTEILEPVGGKSEETILKLLLNVEHMEALRRQQAKLLDQMKQALLNELYTPKKREDKDTDVRKLKIDAALA